ncbi:MAG: NAD(P)H-hydrate dehydratase [Lachnospiraceae bacterium]|nr:NAD(P)H-hydrate dehydratase [Lachnospiraceae bacterium]
MRKLVTASEMKAIEKMWIDNMGISSLALMEVAAQSVVGEIEKVFDSEASVHVFCGYGNNGGDGVAIARLLYADGYDVSISMVGAKNKVTYECMRQIITAQNLNMEFVNWNEADLESKDFVVDAIFGIGLTRDVGGDFKTVIDKINDSKKYVFSVDIPSGTDSDNGATKGVSVKADKTVTLGIEKVGLYLYPGYDNAGEIVLKKIGLNDVFGITERFIALPENNDIDLFLPKRKDDSNKGTYGHVLAFCGSREIAGACILSVEAAYRTGAGLVKAVTEKSNRTAVANAVPESLIEIYDENNEPDYKNDIKWATGFLCGCGLGNTSHSKKILKNYFEALRLSEKEIPCVLDADALNILAEDDRMLDLLPPNCVITPHMLEFSRLTKKNIEEIKNDRLNIALEYAKKHKVVVVLKDSRTCVVDSTGDTFIITEGNNGMSTGGAGDVLAGIIAGIAAQKDVKLFDSAVAGAYLHAVAAKKALENNTCETLIASDISKALPYAYKTCH